MQQRLAEPVSAEVEIPRKLWTRKEAHALADLGLPDIAKLQLINGELIAPIKKRSHVIWKNRVQRWLTRTFGEMYIQSESPIGVSIEDDPFNEPEPDLTVTQQPDEDYPETNPTPGDIRLLVEISDSTLHFDLQVKAKLYARAGIIEYWVIDIQKKRVIVHRSPESGSYASIAAYRSHEEIVPLAAPASRFCLNRL